jgi:muramoyltetrapeptide carboxypeptidase
MRRHIYIYSPSSAVGDRSAFQRGVKRLQSMGHEVEIDADAMSRHQRFAGPDEVRLQAIHRAASSGADVALISRGGYGLSRILGDIRYKKIAKAIANGTQFVGYSDFTALQCALMAKTGAFSWAGPSLCDGFGVAADAQPDDIMLACFDDLLCGQGEGTGWRQKMPGGMPTDLDSKSQLSVEDGLLWGGNLTVLTSLLGTPFFPKVKGGILFLEDVAEHPYRIERCLTQLLHAGVLVRQRAILLGQFTDYRLAAHDRGYKLQSVVDWLRRKITVPVLTNLPFGHVQTRVLLPVGAKCDLHVEGRDALLTWGHL